MQERADALLPDLPPADLSHEEGSVLHLWRRLPCTLRSVLSGLFVFLVIQNG